MKICLISDYLEGGGAEIYLFSIVHALQKAGHSCFIVYDKDLAKPSQLLRTVSCYGVQGVGLCNSERDFRRSKELTRQSAQSLLRIFDGERPDVLHIHSVFNPWLVENLLDCNIPCVKTLHDVRPFASKEYSNSHLLPSWYIEWQERSLETFMSFARIYIFSHYAKGLILDRKPSLSERLAFLSPFSPLRLLTSVSGIPKVPNPRRTEDIDLLFLGRICREKGAEDMIELASMNEFTDQHIALAGLLLDQNLAYRAAQTPNISCLGHLPPKHIASVLQCSKILVFPSKARETLGFSLVDAQDFGVPVVAYDVGAVSEIVLTGLTGFLVKMGDINELRNRTLMLLHDSEVRQSMAGAARTHAWEHFRPDHHFSLLINSYLEVINEKVA